MRMNSRKFGVILAEGDVRASTGRRRGRVGEGRCVRPPGRPRVRGKRHTAPLLAEKTIHLHTCYRQVSQRIAANYVRRGLLEGLTRPKF